VKGKEFFKEVIFKASSLNFASLTPYLLFSVAALTGMNPDVQIPAFALELVTHIKNFVISQGLSRAIKSADRDLKKEDIESVKGEIKDLSKKIELITKQNVDRDDEIANIVKQLINYVEFKEGIKGNNELEYKISKLKDEISVKLDKIKEELSIITKVYLTRIEKCLEKDVEEEAQFFRHKGPLWIDFEKGYVYERPEVEEIIKKLETQDIVVIKGKPASGKSVILRDIGHKLAKQGANVYYIELRKFDDSFAAEVTKIDHGYIIVDDAHININFVEHLLFNKPNAKLIIASRDIDLDKLKGPTSEYRLDNYLKYAFIIEARSTNHDIVKQFEKINGEIPNKIKNKLSENNLWVLAWQLETYIDGKSINENKVLEHVKDYMQALSSRAEDLILPIAALYKYEIPVRKPFIESFVDDETIKRLLEFDEIEYFETDGKEYFILPHSEIASIYLKAFEKYEDLGFKVKIKVKELVEPIFQKYFKKENPKAVVGSYFILLYSIIFPDEFYKATHNYFNGHLTFSFEAQYVIIEELIQGSDFSNKIMQILFNEEDLKNIGDYFFALEEFAFEVSQQGYFNTEDRAKLQDLFNFDFLKGKLEDDNSIKIGWFFYNLLKWYFIGDEIFKLFRKSVLELLNSVDIKKLVAKLFRTDLQDFGNFLNSISIAYPKKAKKIVRILDLEKVKEKIEEGKDEKDGDGIASILYYISKFDPQKAKRLIEIIDLEKIKEMIGEASAFDIESILCSVYKMDLLKAKEVLNSIDLVKLQEKINNLPLNRKAEILITIKNIDNGVVESVLNMFDEVSRKEIIKHKIGRKTIEFLMINNKKDP